MSELARRRRARDLWVSKSHLRAGVALVIALSATSFLLGYVLGRGRAPDPVAAHQASDDALIELLARVEANAQPDAAVRELTFQEALRGGSPEVPAAAPAPVVRTEIPAEPVTTYSVLVVRGDEAAARAAADGLRGAGVAAELRPGAGGEPWEVTVGAWPTTAAGAPGLAVVKAAGYDGHLVQLHP